MFLSIEDIVAPYRDAIVKFKIIDTDFETNVICDKPTITAKNVSIEMAFGAGFIIATTTEIIKEYSKRNLNVAVNIIKLFEWHQCSIQSFITLNKTFSKEFNKYEKDFEKYLVLI